MVGESGPVTLAELFRGHAGPASKELGEVRRVVESETACDDRDSNLFMSQAAPCLQRDAGVDDVLGDRPV